jgi:hypothetical protein
MTKLTKGKNRDKPSIGGVELTANMKDGAKTRFSSLRTSQDSHENHSDTLSVGSMPSTALQLVSSELFVAEMEPGRDHLKLEKHAMTIKALRTSKQKAESDKINSLTANKIRYSTLQGALYGRDTKKLHS